MELKKRKIKVQVLIRRDYMGHRQACCGQVRHHKYQYFKLFNSKSLLVTSKGQQFMPYEIIPLPFSLNLSIHFLPSTTYQY